MEVIPVIVGAIGLVKKNLLKYLESIPGNPRYDEVKLSVLKSTTRILKCPWCL